MHTLKKNILEDLAFVCFNLAYEDIGFITDNPLIPLHFTHPYYYTHFYQENFQRYMCFRKSELRMLVQGLLNITVATA
jgi:hypothetical protein